MHNSFPLSEAAYPYGFVVLIVYGCLLIVLALYFSRLHTRKFFSASNIYKASKNRIRLMHSGNALTRKDQTDEHGSLEGWINDRKKVKRRHHPIKHAGGVLVNDVDLPDTNTVVISAAEQ